MKKERHILAIDGGGTRSRIALADDNGVIKHQIEGGFANLTSDYEASRSNIMTAIQQIYESAQLPAGSWQHDVGVMGIAGANVGNVAVRLAEDLDFARIRVVSDREITIAGVLGKADGTLAQIGTGSFFVSQRQGVTKQIGGWGLQLGDECGGAWLGRELLRCTIKAYDGLIEESALTRDVMHRFQGVAGNIVLFAKTASPQDFGQFAPDIFEAQTTGDKVATAIFRSLIDDLRQILIALDAHKTGRIFLCGSIGERLRGLLQTGTIDGLGNDLTALLSSTEGDGLRGAISLGLELLASTAPVKTS